MIPFPTNIYCTHSLNHIYTGSADNLQLAILVASELAGIGSNPG